MPHARTRLAAPLSLLLLAAGCAGAHRPVPAGGSPAGSSPSAAGTKASTAGTKASAAMTTVPSAVAREVLSVMDREADPCVDFYRYACGSWLSRTSIPADQPRWGRGFSEIRQRNEEVLRAIAEEAARSADAGQRQLGTYYAYCMDEEAIEAAGKAPLAPWLAAVDAATDPRAVMELAARMHGAGAAPWFGWIAAGDFKDPTLAILHVGQGGLGLPDRDYYLRDDEAGKQLLEGYRAHVAHMLALAGQPDDRAQADAGRVLALETELARASRARAELRDPEKTYHRIDRSGLQALTPRLPWDAYFEALGRSDLTAISVSVPEFFEALDGIVADAEPDTLRAYLRWHLVHGVQDLLPRAFQDEDFGFFGRTLQGQQEIEPRWKRCVAAADAGLGDVLARAFIERRFPGDSKQIAVDMIQRVEAAFAARLPELEWMDDATRERALGKMRAIRNQIGYPDRWRTYDGLAMRPGDWFGSAHAARRYELDRQARKVGKPVDRDEWLLTPPTVNAYYHPLLNEMVFLAGILQPPFFDRSFPAAMNFGGIGMVMGHELTHGFDDSGRKFDPQGRMVEWWAPEVAKRFEERAQCVDDLYGTYEVQPGVFLNGKLTLGENIADLGGIKQAYLAYQGWKRDHGAPGSPVPGLTDDQLLFLGYAQSWCTVSTPEFDKLRATTDSHSSPRWRVNGPLSNLAAFATTFSCPAGSPMNPAKKCEVW